jgi:CheY-like chemotaxis protein
VNASEPPNRGVDTAPSSASSGALDGLRIVIVDDDDDARDLLATVLTQRGAEVFVGESAAEALQLVERELPDVLVSDIAMPEEDGYMLIGRVRALPVDRGGNTPSIAVTAYAGRADRKRAIDAGFNDHVAKPIDIDTLVDALIDVHGGAGERCHVAKAQ